MKPLLAMLAIALLSLAGIACGGTGKRSVTSPGITNGVAAQSKPGLDGDGDNDNASGSRHDPDDNFGHPASVADDRMVAALVKRYYRVAATGDGPGACSLIYQILAESIAEEYSQPPAAYGNTCAEVMSKMFIQYHREFTSIAGSLKLTKVVTEGPRAWALFSFTGSPYERRMLVHREGQAWKIDSIVATRLP